MTKRASKATEISIGSTVYFLREEYVDIDNRISRTKWYDVVPIKILSAVFTEDNKVLVNDRFEKNEEENIFEQDFDIDKPSLYADKNAALEYAWELNAESLDENKVAVAEKRKELKKKEEEINVAKGQVEAGDRVSQFLEDWIQAVEDGQTYQS